MKKVIIIGGGIAGLSAGIYAQKSGFDATILESHTMAGGNCTSWKRGGYLFEGGMHWLAGSNPRDPLNQLWRSVGALSDEVAIHYNDPFMVYDYDGTPICLFRDVDATEQHLLTLSPADAKEIKSFCDNIRKAQMGQAIDSAYYEMSSETYANRFCHEGIRELIHSIAGDEQGILMMLFTMGALANGDGGFPEGGSLPFAGRMVKTFSSLGGNILYRTRADRIIIEQNKLTGIMSGNQYFPADAVVITSDTMCAGQLFDMPLKAPWLDEMRAVTGPTMVTLISLGVNADLTNYPEKLIFRLKEPVYLADRTYKYLSINNYAADRTYSPYGKTAITIQLPGDTYDFWKQARVENRYSQEKHRIGDQIISAVAAQIPETDQKIEVIDVATPLTYERYCGNWKGSWMTGMRPDGKAEPYPAAIEGLTGVYFAGQRMMPPGGLPPALITGRTAIQCLCHDMNTEFVG